MIERDEKFPYEKVTLDGLIDWCEWMGKDDHSMPRRENVPMVISRYLRRIKRMKAEGTSQGKHLPRRTPWA